VSDIHLTDALHGTAISKAQTFERFWQRISLARGDRPAALCFVGDLFDIVRSPRWFEGRTRPYHEPSPAVIATIEAITAATLRREELFFAAIRQRVESGELEVHYVLGNHDRLLRYAPVARAAIWKALTGQQRQVEFHNELEFPDHNVLAYHGHVGDAINTSPSGSATIGDAIGSELIVRFPKEVRAVVGDAPAELDDIDDVRPIYAVPAWVRRQGLVRRDLLGPVGSTWSGLVEEFFAKPFVKEWMLEKRRRLGFDTGKKLKLLLELSTKKIMGRAHDQRITQIYKLLQHSFDGKMSRRGALELSRRRHLQYVVNGHSHFASMQPLGHINGKSAVYFNTGTWRTVHQIGHDSRGRPSFLPYDAMSYLVFFPTADNLGRDYEWWTGAMVATDSEVRS